MKLRLLKGIVYNACDRVRGGIFQVEHLEKSDLPAKGEWIIDLKNNDAKDARGKNIKLPFTESFHVWFLKELKKAKIPLKEIKKAELRLKFNFKEHNPISCSCNIWAAEKAYVKEVVFHLFG